MKIGVFGGSFSPIHVGHVSLGRDLVDGGHIDCLWYMVSPQNPLKQETALMPEDVRLRLVQAALRDEAGLEACDFEFSLPRPSYTVHTMAALREAYPQHEFVLVVGADNLLSLDRWYRPDEILRHHRMIVYHRPGYALTDSWRAVVHPLDDRIEIVATRQYDISSTEIRAAMQRPDYDGRGLPPAVWESMRQAIGSRCHAEKVSSR